MNPIADYIPTLIFVAAAFAIPSDATFNTNEDESPIPLVSSEAPISEVETIETRTVEQLSPGDLTPLTSEMNEEIKTASARIAVIPFH